MIRRDYGIKVTQENIYALVTFAARNQLDLSDISDNLHLNARQGLETFVVLNRNVTEQTQRAATLDEMSFYGNWKFQPSPNTVTVTALDFFTEIKPV